MSNSLIKLALLSTLCLLCLTIYSISGDPLSDRQKELDLAKRTLDIFNEELREMKESLGQPEGKYGKIEPEDIEEQESMIADLENLISNY